MRMNIRNVAAVIAMLAIVAGTAPKARAQVQMKPLAD